MPDRPKHERAGARTVPQYEADAEAIREKTERLRALRLARDAANGATAAKTSTSKATTSKGTAAKKQKSTPSDKKASLSEWLAAQQKEGRRS